MFSLVHRIYIPGNRIGMYYYKTKTSLRILEFFNITKEPKLLPDRFMLEPYVLILPRRNFLFEVLDQKLEQLFEAHLLGYYLKHDYYKGYFEKMKTNELPYKILTLRELEAGFVVSIAPLILGVLIFCIEWLIVIKDLLVFKTIFKVYFKLKELEQDQKIKQIRISTIKLNFILER